MHFRKKEYQYRLRAVAQLIADGNAQIPVDLQWSEYVIRNFDFDDQSLRPT
jgi:hypothetical protein